MKPLTAGRAVGLADLVAGVSIAGLLLPQAVAYSSIAGLPPQTGVIALLAGLLVYGVLGGSRFAIVSATSSSAVVLLAATSAMAPGDPALRWALGIGMVLLSGVFFVIAGLARLGGIVSLIAKPVLRGFTLGLSLTIVLQQLPKVLAVQPAHSDFFRFAWELGAGWRHWNLAGAAMALAALALLQGLARWRVVPAAPLVIAAGIALDVSGWCHAWGITAVGPITLNFSHPGLPQLALADWLRMGELAFAMTFVLYAESYGSIRSFALLHGDRMQANRDLLALGAANIASGLFQGMPVGAGYSGTAANEAAGAQSRAAGLAAGAVVLAAVLTLLPWIAHTPEPMLAAIVIHPLVRPGLLIARPVVPLFFGNVDAVFATIHERMAATRPLTRLVLSLEESPDLDGTSIEALCDLAAYTRQQGAELVLARVKDTVRDVLSQVCSPDLPDAAYESWSVDDAVQVAAPVTH